MKDTEIHEASYKSALFFVTSSSVTGGRKDVLKAFPNSDQQLIEDMGLLPRTFSIQATIAPRLNSAGEEIQSYTEMRDALLAALEEGGPGRLVHPFYDPADNIVSRTYSLSEDFKTIGTAKIGMTFAISDTDGVPKLLEEAYSSLTAQNNLVKDVVGTDITDNFSVTAAFAGNFADAMDKVNGIVDMVNTASTGLTVVATEIDSYTKQLSEFSENITTLVSNPEDLAISVDNLFASMNGVYATAKGTYEAFKGMFAYGDDDVPFVSSTAGRVERQTNRDTLNGAIQSSAMGYAYLNASQIPFENTVDIAEVEEDLETQYQKLLEADWVIGEVLDEVTKMRTKTQNYLDSLKLTVRRIITINTPMTSARALAYQYYGSTELAEAIAELNKLDDMAFMEGDIQVFTA